MRRFLAGLLSILMLLIPTPSLASEAAPADAAGAQADEAEAASVNSGGAPVNEAALALLRMIDAIEEGVYQGDVRVEVDGDGFGIWARLGIEAYIQGENALLQYRTSLFGQPLNVGIALYENATWLSMDGTWLPLAQKDGSEDLLEALGGLGVSITPDTAAEDLLRHAQLSVSEETVEGITYDVLHVTWDGEALAALIEQILPGAVNSDPAMTLDEDAVPEVEAFAVTGEYWIVRETQTLHRATSEVSLKLSDPAVTITGTGDLYFRPLEAPIPFPAEITSPAVPASDEESAETAGTAVPVQDLLARVREGSFKASGQIHASVSSDNSWGGVVLDAQLYAKGSDRLARTQGTLLGTPLQSGAAVRGNSFSTLESDGSWRQVDGALPGVRPFDNPAAFLVLLDGAWSNGEVTVSELDLFDGAVYVIEVQGGPAAVAALYGAGLAADPESEVSVTLLVDKETGLPIQQDVFVWVVDEEGMIHSLYGTLEFEAWEAPLPFPGESLSAM